MHVVVSPVNRITVQTSSPPANVAMEGSSLQANTLSSNHHPTVVRFEYDGTGVAAIGFCENGGPVQEYIIPEGRIARLSRVSMLIRHILPTVKLVLDKILRLS